ncbi:Pectin lyase [Phytophthora megakarya]|uniref:pectin lyase n=1 Tax=Phytophthora megakarya TaxID=4795 RepID=A0A225VAV5_9STRA|nr:Pectin lyase [Phytophthora megakarya]
MGLIRLVIASTLALAAKSASAFSIGSPTGLAAGTTGGAKGTTVYPTTNQELIDYLNASEPLVVVLNKTFDFRGTEGKTTEIGCRPQSARECIALNNGFKSQDVILRNGWNNTGGCENGTETTITYDNAFRWRMNVTSHKTIRGIGRSGVIMGKGITLRGDNIIVQNIHITELNRHLVWGGDALYMEGTVNGTKTMNNIWIDHVKVSRVGRQMLVTNKAGVATMTVSNSDFDGETDYSATCNGRHYWTILIYGKNTGISMFNNYVHSTSGRSPKVGDKNSSVIAHVANNYWDNLSNHSFELDGSAYMLAEGNYFNNVKNPLYKTGKGFLYAATSADECTKYLGRACEENTLVKSGNFTSRDGTLALETLKKYPAITDYSSGSDQKKDSAHQSEDQTSSADDSTQQSEQVSLTLNTVNQYSPGTLKATQSEQEPIETSNLEKVWKGTTSNFGVGKLD